MFWNQAEKEETRGQIGRGWPRQVSSQPLHPWGIFLKPNFSRDSSHLNHWCPGPYSNQGLILRHSGSTAAGKKDFS